MCQRTFEIVSIEVLQSILGSIQTFALLLNYHIQTFKIYSYPVIGYTTYQPTVQHVHTIYPFFGGAVVDTYEHLVFYFNITRISFVSNNLSKTSVIDSAPIPNALQAFKPLLKNLKLLSRDRNLTLL